MQYYCVLQSITKYYTPTSETTSERRPPKVVLRDKALLRPKRRQNNVHPVLLGTAALQSTTPYYKVAQDFLRYWRFWDPKSALFFEILLWSCFHKTPWILRSFRHFSRHWQNAAPATNFDTASSVSCLCCPDSAFTKNINFATSQSSAPATKNHALALWHASKVLCLPRKTQEWSPILRLWSAKTSISCETSSNFHTFETVNRQFSLRFSYETVFTKRQMNFAKLPPLFKTLTKCCARHDFYPHHVCVSLTLRFVEKAHSPRHILLRLPRKCMKLCIPHDPKTLHLLQQIMCETKVKTSTWDSILVPRGEFQANFDVQETSDFGFQFFYETRGKKGWGGNLLCWIKWEDCTAKRNYSRMRSEGFPFIVGVWGWTCVRVAFVMSSCRRPAVVVSLISPPWAAHTQCNAILSFKLWKVEEVSHEMLVLAQMGGHFRVLRGSRNTLEACQCKRVVFSWQAQHFAMRAHCTRDPDSPQPWGPRRWSWCLTGRLLSWSYWSERLRRGPRRVGTKSRWTVNAWTTCMFNWQSS